MHTSTADRAVTLDLMLLLCCLIWHDLAICIKKHGIPRRLHSGLQRFALEWWFPWCGYPWNAAMIFHGSPFTDIGWHAASLGLRWQPKLKQISKLTIIQMYVCVCVWAPVCGRARLETTCTGLDKLVASKQAAIHTVLLCCERAVSHRMSPGILGETENVLGRSCKRVNTLKLLWQWGGEGTFAWNENKDICFLFWF